MPERYRKSLNKRKDGTLLEDVLRSFEGNVFMPKSDSAKLLPNEKGVYIITVQDKEALPLPMRDLRYSYLAGRPIVYVGISNKSLRVRDYRSHFKGNTRGSTLRKSLGSLLSLAKKRTESILSKYRFEKDDEVLLSEWMINNLVLHYFVIDNPLIIEKLLIDQLNPPLNLKDNKNIENIDFRIRLKELRR